MGNPWGIGSFRGGGEESLVGAINKYRKKFGGKILKIGKKIGTFFFSVETALEMTLNLFKTKKSLKKIKVRLD